MRKGDRFLVFMLKPPAGLAERIDAVRGELGIDRRYAPERLHVTLAPLGVRETLGEARVARALAVAAAIRAAPFRVTFDRVEAGVLRASEPLPGLVAFQAMLVRELVRADVIAPPDRTYRPHVTLAYGDRAARSADVLHLGWRVEEFRLVDSVQGEQRHVDVARWALRSA